MKQAIRFFNEAMGSGATPAQIHKNISKALKSAGFRVKKFEKMTWGHGGVWGGFYTVDDGMVLPFHVKKDGKVSYDAGPKDWIIGNIDYVDVMTRILKQVKKTPGYGQGKLSKVRRTKKIANEISTLGTSGLKSFAKKHKYSVKSKKSGGRVSLIYLSKDGKQFGPFDPTILTKKYLLKKLGLSESVNEAVVASMRTSSGQRDLELKGGKLTMKMPNGEVLKFKDGADVKEYMDRIHGYWSFIKGYGKVKGLREIKTDSKAVVGVRTSKGPIDIFIEKGKPVIYARNERLEFKNGKDVREYLDRLYGYWSFFKGKDNNPIKGLKESTAAYEKALQKIAKDKQLSMLSKKDRETLLKVAKLMQSANEDEKWSGLGYDSFEDEKMDERVAMPLGQHLQDAQKELDYMIKVGPIEDAYDSPKVSLKVIKMARKLLDKVN